VWFYQTPWQPRRAWVVHQVQAVAGGEAALAALTAPDFDPAATVVLEKDAVAGAAAATSEPISLTGTLNTVTIRVTLSQPGWVVLADTYYPGWTATLDGRPAEILRADYAFRAVRAEAGEHTLIFEYHPRSFAAGLWVTGLSVVLGVAAAVLTWRES
jgi:hypothetical protein